MTEPSSQCVSMRLAALEQRRQRVAWRLGVLDPWNYGQTESILSCIVWCYYNTYIHGSMFGHILHLWEIIRIYGKYIFKSQVSGWAWTNIQPGSNQKSASTVVKYLVPGQYLWSLYIVWINKYIYTHVKLTVARNSLITVHISWVYSDTLWSTKHSTSAMAHLSQTW